MDIFENTQRGAVMAKKNYYEKDINGHKKTRDAYKKLIGTGKLDAKNEEVALNNKKLHIRKMKELKRAGK